MRILNKFFITLSTIVILLVSIEHSTVADASVGLEIDNEQRNVCVLIGLGIHCFERFERDEPVLDFDFSEENITHIQQPTIYGDHVCVIADSRVKCVGSIALSRNKIFNYSPETFFADFVDVSRIAAANNNGFCAFDNQKGLRCIDAYQLSSKPSLSGSKSKLIERTDAEIKVRQLAVSSLAACVITDLGQVQCWGEPQYLVEEDMDLPSYRKQKHLENARLKDTIDSIRAVPIFRKAVTEIFVQRSFACAKLEDRTLQCWGSGSGPWMSEFTFEAAENELIGEGFICRGNTHNAYRCVASMQLNGSIGLDSENGKAIASYINGFDGVELVASSGGDLCIADSRTNSIEVAKGEFKFHLRFSAFTSLSNPEMSASLEQLADHLYPNRAAFVLAAAKLSRTLDSQSVASNLASKKAERYRVFIWHALVILLNDAQTSYIRSEVLPNLTVSISQYDAQNNLPQGLMSYERDSVTKDLALRLSAYALEGIRDAVVVNDDLEQWEKLYNALGHAIVAGPNSDNIELKAIWGSTAPFIKKLMENADTRPFTLVLASTIEFFLR